MEVSQLWSVLYFFMLLLLGIGSMLGNTAAILTPLTDSKVISSYLPKETCHLSRPVIHLSNIYGAPTMHCPILDKSDPCLVKLTTGGINNK